MTISEADIYIHKQLAALGIKMHVSLDEDAQELTRDGCDEIIAFAVALYEKHNQKK